MKFDIWVFFENHSKKISLIKIWQEERVLYVKTYVHLSFISEFFLKWEMFQTKVVEKIKTHFMFRAFFSENGTVHEIMWKNLVPDRLQVTI